MQSRSYAMATAATGLMCLCIALLQVTDMLGARQTVMLEVGSQFQNSPVRHIVPLPDAGETGTDKAFIGMGDGSGQSTMDNARFQALAGKPHARPHAKWHPLSPAQLGYKLPHKRHMIKRHMQHLAQAPPQQIAQGNIYANLAGHGKDKKNAQGEAPHLWPDTVIGQKQPPNLQPARPWQSHESPTGEMGTNGVFLGAHQGGDAGFSSQPMQKIEWDSRQGKARFAVPVLYQQNGQGAQLWPSSAVGQAPPMNDNRRKYPQTAVDGSLI